MGSAHYVDEASEQSEIRRLPDKVPHYPIPGTPTDSASNEKLQVASLVLGDATALRAIDGYSKFCFRVQSVPRTLVKFGMPCAASGLLFSGSRSAFETAEGMSGKMESAQIFERNLRRFPGLGARTWLLERGTGLPRGTYFCLAAADRFSSLNTFLLASGFPAYRLVLGFDPADISCRGGDGEDLLSA